MYQPLLVNKTLLDLGLSRRFCGSEANALRILDYDFCLGERVSSSYPFAEKHSINSDFSGRMERNPTTARLLLFHLPRENNNRWHPRSLSYPHHHRSLRASFLCSFPFLSRRLDLPYILNSEMSGYPAFVCSF